MPRSPTSDLTHAHRHPLECRDTLAHSPRPAAAAALPPSLAVPCGRSARRRPRPCVMHVPWCRMCASLPPPRGIPPIPPTSTHQHQPTQPYPQLNDITAQSQQPHPHSCPHSSPSLGSFLGRIHMRMHGHVSDTAGQILSSDAPAALLDAPTTWTSFAWIPVPGNFALFRYTT